MTWSHDPATGTYTGANVTQALVAFMLDMNGTGDPTSAKGGWKVGTGGMGGGDICCLFSYLSGDGVIRHSQFSLDYSSYSEGQVANTKINTSYDPTETDPNNNSAFPFEPTVNSTSLPEADIHYVDSPPLTIWKSSENPTAFLGIVANKAIASWFPITEMTTTALPKAGGYNNVTQTTYLDYVMMLPSFNGATSFFCGPPINAVNDDVNLISYPPSLAGSTLVEQKTNMVFKDMTLGRSKVIVAKLANDTMYNMPEGADWGIGGLYTCYNNNATSTANNTVQPAFDGTNYYLYLAGQYGTGPLSQCWVLDLGPNQYPL